MKQLMLLFGIMILTFGCKSYVQLFETNSNNVSVKNKVYVSENDSLKITYNFWKEKGLMGFEIYNKLDVPLYIDWRKSSYVDNSVKLNYWQNVEKISAIYRGYYYRGNSKGTSNETRIKEERITFIPPNSKYSRVEFYIYPKSHSILDKKGPYREVAMYEGSKKRTKLYEMSFTREESPLIFRNFLTFSLTEEFNTEFYVDNEFYVSKIIEMDEKHFFGRHLLYSRRPTYGHRNRELFPYQDDRFFFIELGK